MANITEPRFECCHCHGEVTPTPDMGTMHRNHCNKCLWSKHVDQTPGDRTSVCGGCMEPLGVTLKHEGTDKYGKERLGDVMLIHRCTVCELININRIAADDPNDIILKVFESSSSLLPEEVGSLAKLAVVLLTDKKILEERLFGKF